MKSIKVRMYNPDANKMHFDLENVFDCLKQQLAYDKIQSSRGFVLKYDHKADGFIWMLFTGELDTNDVEVYKDDVIKCPKGVNDVIDFKYGAFWLKKRDVSLYHFKYVLKSPIEVIGNIHINPEIGLNVKRMLPIYSNIDEEQIIDPAQVDLYDLIEQIEKEQE